MKVIEVVADAGHLDTLVGIAEQHGALDVWYGQTVEDQRRAVRMLVADDKRQGVLDALQKLLASSDNARILILPVEAVLPRAAGAEEEEGQRKSTGAAATREELYNQIEKGAHLDGTYLVMVFLSTVVAAIGLLENNVAVVVGAMVIAPLLGPNIALAFATSLGDGELMWSASRTSLVGIGLALLLSVVIGMLWPVWPPGPEVEARTAVGFDGVVLALASGAAAVLSLTSGVASALVGVMVAVALLPPTAVLGMLLGSGHLAEAAGAALLLAVNIVCVNLSANLVFLFKGVRPRTWLEKRRAKQSVWLSGLVWLIALLLLLGILYGQRLVG